MPQYYPLFMDLKAQPVLVVGGGNIAFRKVQTLLHHEAVVYIVSPKLIPELRELVDGRNCIWSEKEYAAEDLKQAVLVFSCTEIEEVNARVSADSRASFRPVNVVDDPEKCSFIVPSLLERGDLKIAVSTGGSSPIVARQVRAELEDSYGEEMADYLRLLKSWRGRAKTELPPQERSLFWEKVTDGEIRELIKAGRLTEAEGVIEQCFLSLLA